MIIERKKNKPFKYMVLDDRRKVMDQFGPTGGWWVPFCEYMNTEYNLSEDNDFVFEDWIGRGNTWKGTFVTFKDLKHAKIFEKEFGKGEYHEKFEICY